MSSIDNTEITKRNHYDQKLKVVFRSMAIVLSIWAITIPILYIQVKHMENANAFDYTLVTVEDYVARTLFGTNESIIDITDDTVKANATFHQKIHVGNRRIFNSAELSNFELLMQSFTSKFVTANNYDCLQINSNEDINDTIITLATVKKQSEDIAIDDTNDEDTASNNTTSFVINLVYVVSFESIVCNDVKYYPLLFQNYTNGHLNIVLRDLQILDLNVTQIEKAKRPVYNK
ncbi:hypothetical protein FRACYDRAFT_235584 [Fragilariopsis cylindrus CCMP1102]|uniref:Uncharacterized protein n=1 Tax=Fragilariopsis cylindrus CCMP1102 TaxID=635003 RepID=A0A1E7FN05_9STRA|nr:hypothetical protein FRACYDRAFT_235584 [Fragilariopsis cylindrus CCMP1102]|eukprot:OEU19526.1 hypothetical protein FRACYDRAFT_235584 [Fragilariopsis cylindrus CCMP1102]